MDDVVILKTTHDMHDGVHLADVGQEFVAEAFPLTGALHQTSNIHKLHAGGNGLRAAAQCCELLKTSVRNRHRADIGLDRAEREVRSLSLGIGDQSIEESGFAHVGQTDDSGFKHGGESIGRRQAGSPWHDTFRTLTRETA